MKFKHITAVALSGALLAGFSGGAGAQTANAKSKDTIKVSQIKTSPKQAVKKAKSVYGGQKVKEIAFEKSHGKWAYKVSQHKPGKESEVIVANKTNKVLSKETEKEDHMDKSKSFNYKDAINYKKALKKGQSKFKGDIGEWSLSKKHGKKLVYDMDLKKGKTKHEVSVDAKSGKVLSNEKDD
jgi:uncharacterized membrane protein YkoI